MPAGGRERKPDGGASALNGRDDEEFDRHGILGKRALAVAVAAQFRAAAGPWTRTHRREGASPDRVQGFGWGLRFSSAIFLARLATPWWRRAGSAMNSSMRMASSTSPAST